MCNWYFTIKQSLVRLLRCTFKFLQLQNSKSFSPILPSSFLSFLQSVWVLFTSYWSVQLLLEFCCWCCHLPETQSFLSLCSGPYPSTVVSLQRMEHTVSELYTQTLHKSYTVLQRFNLASNICDDIQVSY